MRLLRVFVVFALLLMDGDEMGRDTTPMPDGRHVRDPPRSVPIPAVTMPFFGRASPEDIIRDGMSQYRSIGGELAQEGGFRTQITNGGGGTPRGVIRNQTTKGGEGSLRGEFEAEITNGGGGALRGAIQSETKNGGEGSLRGEFVSQNTTAPMLAMTSFYDAFKNPYLIGAGGSRQGDFQNRPPESEVITHEEGTSENSKINFPEPAHFLDESLPGTTITDAVEELAFSDPDEPGPSTRVRKPTEKERKRAQRAGETQVQREQRLSQNSISKKRVREKISREERAIITEQQSTNHQNARIKRPKLRNDVDNGQQDQPVSTNSFVNESDAVVDRTQIRRNAKAAFMTETRRHETPDQTQARRDANTAQMAASRQHETDEQMQMRRNSNANRMTQLRQNETQQQTQARRASNAARMVAARQTETHEERQARLAAQAARQTRYRNLEAPQQRDARLAAARDVVFPARAGPRQPSTTAGGIARYHDQIPDLHDLGPMNTECTECHAMHWPQELNDRLKFSMCCRKGKIKLQIFLNYPDELKALLIGTERCHKAFREHIRNYNSSLATASIVAKLETPRGHGPVPYKVHGQVVHLVGGLVPQDGQMAQCAQILIMDTGDAANELAGRQVNRKCEREIFIELHDLLNRINPFARAFKMMQEVYHQEEQNAQANGRDVQAVKMVFAQTNHDDLRRYNAATSNEVAAVYVGNDEEIPGRRLLVVHDRQQGLRNISYLDKNCDPMCYPLLFPRGDFGWHPALDRVQPAGSGHTRVTQMDFYAYHVFKRPNVPFNPLHHSCKLFQQWLVDSWIKIEQNRLDFLKKGQKPMRLDTLQGLRDHQNDPNAAGPSGQKIILSAKHQGSPRNKSEGYKDALAIMQRYGKPDLFLTFTANPGWIEITRELEPGQTAMDRPDLVGRVFYLKMDQLDDELNNKHILGQLMAHVSVIEFQKRGLPHRHMLLWLTPHWKLRTAGDVNHLITAELPEDPTSRLYAIVTKCMMHRACGLANPDSPCMKDGECSKGFPKQYQNDTVISNDSYPKYRRRNDGRTVMNGGVQLDNRHVVPYNPYLLLRFEAHINLEVCAWFNVVKYLFKYCYKGTDRARVCLQMGVNGPNQNGNPNNPAEANPVVDEIKQFIDARFVGPNEAVHRMLGMKMDKKSDVVISLIVHLEDYQPIVYDVNRANDALVNAELKDTTLTAWFAKNKEIRELEEELGALPAGILDTRTIYYVEMPEFYTFPPSSKKWNQRKRVTERTIGRIHNVSPKDHEAYALRVLLLYRKGIESFEEMRTINGVVHPTYVEAARAAGYLQDDGHNRRSMQEAANYQMPDQLRSFFAMLLVYCEMSDGVALWNEFKDDLMADYVHRGLPLNVCESKAYWDLGDKLTFQGLDINKVLGLNIPQINGHDAPIDTEAHRLAGEAMYAQLNEEQEEVAKAVLEAIENPQGQCYFIDGPGGSGKTFVYTCINHIATSKGKKVDCVAWTGIAANLLPGGRTVNATFKLNVKQDNKISTMKRQSKEARLLAETDVFIWDEAPMAPSHALEAVDALLKDIMQNDLRFGGKIFLLGGDFRQVLPVVERGGRGDQVAVCLRRSTIWPEFVQFTLTHNMRVQGDDNDWKEWVLKVGNDEIPKDVDQNIQVPPEIRSNGDLVDEIFGPIIRNGGELADAAILCPKNQQALETNNNVLEMLPGDLQLARSIDEAITTDPRDSYHFTTELMNSMTPTGLPPHELFLKVGAIVMLLRNLDVQNGLCNGTRLIIEQIQTRVLLCRFATGSRKGKQVLIPRIDCQYEKNLPFTLKRRQFPIRLSFAMTINKSQGQSFDRVGLDLSTPIFSHGQAYVAISRCKSRDGVRILAANDKMANVVYREVLAD